MTEPLMTDEQLDGALEARPAARVTKESIEARIKSQEYHIHGKVTIALLTMVNGYVVVGFSACVSPENFDAEIGRRLAYDDAFRQLWALEGYLLAERMLAER